jgi:hypothetical protein
MRSAHEVNSEIRVVAADVRRRIFMTQPTGANASKIARINILSAFWLDTELSLIKISNAPFAATQMGHLYVFQEIFEPSYSFD